MTGRQHWSKQKMQQRSIGRDWSSVLPYPRSAGHQCTLQMSWPLTHALPADEHCGLQCQSATVKREPCLLAHGWTPSAVLHVTGAAGG